MSWLSKMTDMKTILLTGATGYVGRHLLRALEGKGHKVRCLARRPESLQGRAGEGVEVVRGDVLDADTLAPAVRGVETAYYLVHSMGGTGGFEEDDRRAARNFGQAARKAGVRRVIYLGGLASGEQLSSHLASRIEVGNILRESGVPVVEFRASVIIGAGSLSFDMIRALVEKLPVMITPRWVRTMAQPIYINDVVEYLTGALDLSHGAGEVFEIGGADRASYKDIMDEYARQRGLRRAMIPVPLLTPWLSSLWLALVTPVLAKVGRKLIEGVANESVVNDPKALRVFPILPRAISESIRDALREEDAEFAASRWSGAPAELWDRCGATGVWLGSRVLVSYEVSVPRPASASYAAVASIGGANGYYYANWLWRLRGWLDRAIGGPGLRVRRPEEALRPGDAIDFWRIEHVEPGALLRLCAEMRLPGRAWLQFEVEGDGERSRIRQTSLFDPLGLGGRLYWLLTTPFHMFVFPGMAKGLARAALRFAAADHAPGAS